MTTDVAIRHDPLPMTFSETMHLGGVLAESGFFKDTRSAAQAVAKVLAGRELGFGPMASMSGIYVIEGKISIGANLMAAAVKRSGKYNYQVKRWEDDGCTLEFFEGGRSVGLSTFDADDAKTAGLQNKDNWRKYPRNQYFARALANGTRIYCPDVLGGEVVYTPDEMDITVDEEGEPIGGDLIVNGARVAATVIEEDPDDVTYPSEAPPRTAPKVGKSPAQSVAPNPNKKVEGVIVGIGGSIDEPIVTIEKGGLRKQFAIDDQTIGLLPDADDLGSAIVAYVRPQPIDDKGTLLIVEVVSLDPFTPLTEAGEQATMGVEA